MYTSAAQLEEFVQTVFEKEMLDLQLGNILWRIKLLQGKKFIDYPNSDTLTDIFATVHKDDQLSKSFLDLMQNRVEWDQENEPSPGICLTVSALCFYTLIKLGFSGLALESFITRLQSSNCILRIISDLLQEDVRHFDSLQLALLHEGLKRMEVSSNLEKERATIISNLVTKRYELLKKQIRNINVEINYDKKTVIEKIAIFDFDQKYIQFLQELDLFITQETADIIEFTMIEKFRVFMEGFIHELAARLSGILKTPLVQEKGEDRTMAALEYLNLYLGLSERDNIFICSFIDLLHAEGGQVFLSSRDFFRLIRNIAIEIALLLVKKYEMILDINEINRKVG